MKFSKFATLVSDWLGRPVVFAINFILVIGWIISGHFFKWSDTFMFVGNSFMSAIAFLAVFILQHTQNRDSEALHKKLDGIIDALDKADNNLKGIEKDLEDVSKCK